MSKPSLPFDATLIHPDRFENRHLGPDAGEVGRMLQSLGATSLDDLVAKTIPAKIRTGADLKLPAPRGEFELLADLRQIASRNKVFRSYIGLGYHDCIVPGVIQRNVLENPGWYTQYTPYQAEIAQGRLESLLNFQTMIMDLTGMEIANASLLDEATAAAEGMALALAQNEAEGRNVCLVSSACLPQTIELLRTRAEPLGIEVQVADHAQFKIGKDVFAIVLQYPTADGAVEDYRGLIEQAHTAGALAIVAADLLSLTLLTPPGEFGADVVVGSAQRFGVPLGFGGPHAAFFATKDKFKRQMPGRLVGVSKDARGKPAFRLSLQTREQHIRREKATSNICTAQALLANMAVMYAIYHGPAQLRAIAEMVHRHTVTLARALTRLGCEVGPKVYFDTLRVKSTKVTTAELIRLAENRQINLRVIDGQTVGVSLNETTTLVDVSALLEVFNGGKAFAIEPSDIPAKSEFPQSFARTSKYLTHPVFNQYHSETDMLRYLRKLESRDLSLTHSMIPLGSCTMKLNASAEMFPVSWPEFSRVHPFVPLNQVEGYLELFRQLEAWLAEITGFSGVSLQPNAGSQGEYAGLLAIHKYHESRGQKGRDICLIPSSAHGTNPASAVMAGLQVVPVACDDAGNIDIEDLRKKTELHREKLSTLMVTYPSTHGVFEEGIREICQIMHAAGGQVYMDGANLNAQVGLCRPGEIGADVCHINLHKTFCIPHGGGGPGMGPICVASHLTPFLPGNPLTARPDGKGAGPVSAANWGSASILTISWVYIALMGAEGLKKATQVAILNANYIAKRLNSYFPVLYTGSNGTVAHECILDLRAFKLVTVEDVAKRLMDYGFHAPTISWPVPGTMMVEPTESESKAELDRFCEAMIAIHAEIKQVESGAVDKANNLLKNAPHTADVLVSSKWDRSYSRETAAFPLPWVNERKFWPAVARIDNVYGDRNLVCSCVGMEAYTS